MKKVFVCIMCFSFISCTQEVNEKMLLFDNGKYYLKSSKALFTGTLITRFDDGKISGSFNYKNGVANGKWYTKGFYGEIIQEGEYLDITTSEIKLSGKFELSGLSLWNEGSQTFVTLDILSKENDRLITDSLLDEIYRVHLKPYGRQFSEIKMFSKDSLLLMKTFKDD